MANVLEGGVTICTGMSAAEIMAEVEAAGDPDLVKDSFDGIPENTSTPLRFMNKSEVATYLGLAGLYSLTDAVLPPPDVIVGDRQGWTEKTIDTWNAARPGRGRWGPRKEPAAPEPEPLEPPAVWPGEN